MASSVRARLAVTDLPVCSADYDEYEVSPYEELEVELVRNMELSRMASIMAGRHAPDHGRRRPWG